LSLLFTHIIIQKIEGPPSESQDFDTQTGVVPPDQPLIHVDTDILKVPAGTDYTVEWLFMKKVKFKK